MKSWRSALNHAGRGIPLSCILLFLPPTFAFGQTKDTSGAKEVDQTFTLYEVPALDPSERALGSLLGQRVVCGHAPDANVITYPTFKSGRPLYGKVSFPPAPDGQDSGIVYRFAFDESEGTGRGYDRLYFDLNHDRDLTDDKPLVPQRDLTSVGSSNVQVISFETAAVPFPFGGKALRPLELMARLIVSNDGIKLLTFIATKARQGVIQLGDHNYRVRLSHGSLIAGWFDHPTTTLYLAPIADNMPWTSRPGVPLMATRKIDGTFYRFSATPAGDKLTVHRYSGPLGDLKLSPSPRNVGRILATGSLTSATTTVPVFMSRSDGGSAASTDSCQLPIGDYRLEGLQIQFDNLSLMVLCNHRFEDNLGDRSDREGKYAIAIRAERPFVLDFSRKPHVLFTAPNGDTRIKLGQELMVKAVLVDPSLGIRFRRLERDGNVLQPKVSLARAGDEIIAEGVMPFG